MDLLHQRYASPFSFMGAMMQSGRFSEFVDEIVQTYNEDRKEKSLWDFYLHKVNNPEVTFKDFLDEIETNEKLQNMSDDDKADALQTAMNILGNFNPLNEKGE
jgi:hypothetical protein